MRMNDYDASDEALIIDVDGYEGPLDLLLSLSRTQKVDLMRISVLQLAEQYLAFVDRVRALRIELAADYLVMAAWLAYLKSKLLLPPMPGDDGPSAEDLAAHLAFQLERLSAMRDVAARLMARDHKGRDFFVRGAPETVARSRALRSGAQSVNESPQEQERFESGLRNTKPVFTMVFSKSSSDPLMKR
jgi:segregation and condensation protein A